MSSKVSSMVIGSIWRKFCLHGSCQELLLLLLGGICMFMFILPFSFDWATFGGTIHTLGLGGEEYLG